MGNDAPRPAIRGQRGFVLLVTLMCLLFLATVGLALNRSAGVQARIGTNRVRAMQVRFGLEAGIEDAVWRLRQNPAWRTAPTGDPFIYQDIDFSRIVKNSSLSGYTDAIEISLTPSAASTSLRQTIWIGSSGADGIYIADSGNNVIRKIDTATGLIHSKAGTAQTGGYGGDQGPAAIALLNAPGALIGDTAGNIFIADSTNHRIRKVAAETGFITTIAGTGIADYSGDGGPADQARFNSPEGLDRDIAGNLYVADTQNHCIRRIDAVTNVVTTVAGQCTTFGEVNDGVLATSALLKSPEDVALDSAGNLFIAETGNHNILRVDAATQIRTRIAGDGSIGYYGDGVSADQAILKSPGGIHVDSAGNVFIADTGNYCIRKIDTGSIITTVVGVPGSIGYNGDGLAATDTRLKLPEAVLGTANGDIYIADTGNQIIRKMDYTTGLVHVIAGTPGSQGFVIDGGPALSAKLKSPEGISLAPLIQAGNSALIIREIE